MFSNPSFPQAVTYSDSRKPPLGITFNYFIPLGKLRTISRIDVSLAVPSALLSACIVGDRGGTTSGRADHGELGVSRDPGLCCRVTAPKQNRC